MLLDIEQDYLKIQAALSADSSEHTLLETVESLRRERNDLKIENIELKENIKTPVDRASTWRPCCLYDDFTDDPHDMAEAADIFMCKKCHIVRSGDEYRSKFRSMK